MLLCSSLLAASVSSTAAVPPPNPRIIGGWTNCPQTCADSCVPPLGPAKTAWGSNISKAECMQTCGTDGSGGFSAPSADGDTTEGIFTWDGSFASYMLSLSAPELALSNLVAVVKARTSAGFLPSYSNGALKSRDRSNPPVTSRVLREIVRRWGAGPPRPWLWRAPATVWARPGQYVERA